MMLKTIDRMLFTNFLRAYAICLVSMLSLYIIVDLFTNIDDFAQEGRTLPQVVEHIITFYTYNSIQIFDRLCEAIVLLAAMFTIAWMQRSNEMIPLLAGGISMHRILQPLLLGSAVMISLGVVNQELVIPNIAERLMAKRDDPIGDKVIEVQGAFDKSGIHVEGLVAVRKDLRINYFYVCVPESPSSSMMHFAAREAVWVPKSKEKYSGGWLMTGTTPAEPDSMSQLPKELVLIDPGRYFLYTDDVTFDRVTQQRKWFVFYSTTQLRNVLERPESQRLPAVAVLFHMRLTRPIIGMLLVIIGLGIILRDQNRHVFISTGMCLAMCALFYACVFGCKYLGENDLLPPALSAWVPVIVFTPFAIASFDAIQT